MEKDSSLYAAIYAHLLSDIKAGVYDGGVRLPTEKELTERFFVSRITAKRALNNLAEAGLVVRIPGRGTFLKGTDPVGQICDLKSIMFLLDDLYDEWGMEALRGAFDEGRCHGTPLSAAIGDEASQCMGCDGVIRIKRCDGLAIKAERKSIKNSRIKVKIDLETAAHIAEEKLLEAGHRHVLYIYDKNKLVLPLSRDSGIEYTELECTACGCWDRLERLCTRIKEILEEKPEITCVFAASHYGLQAAMMERSIGSKVRMLAVSALGYPANMGLSVIGLPMGKAGAEAVKLLKELRCGNGAVQKEIVLEPTYIEKGSL